MAAATQQYKKQLRPPQGEKQHILQDAATATGAAAVDGAFKGNTDCVYFLASPLTCKKGSECEYRHSEYARLNPRDCYFWLSGTCWNPKCGYRHPPLDGLLGTQMAAPAGPFMAPSRAAPAGSFMAPSKSAPAGPFMAPSKAAPAAMNAPTVAFSGSGRKPIPCFFFQKGICLKGDKCTFLHGTPTNKSSQMVPPPAPSLPPQAQPSNQKPTFDTNVQRERFSLAAVVSPEAAKPPAMSNLIPELNGSAVVSPINQVDFDERREVDDLWRESSPGFDVLVDDELRNSDYYVDDDRYEQDVEGINLDSVQEYDVCAAADYGGPQNPLGRYLWDGDQMDSSERPSSTETFSYSTRDGSERFDSDLRYRLSKNRTINGLKSVVSQEYLLSSRSRLHGVPSSNEFSVRDRFRGRLTLPDHSPTHFLHLPARNFAAGVNPPADDCDSQVGGALADYNKSANFAGPKSLAELKMHGKRKHAEVLSFDGPMPLAEILKRKREAKLGLKSKMEVANGVATKLEPAPCERIEILVPEANEQGDEHAEEEEEELAAARAEEELAPSLV